MYKAIATNKRNTILIMMGFVVLISIIGAGFAWYFDDWSVLIYVFSISAVYAVFQYFIAGSLAVMMAGAKEITKKDNPRLYNIVENLSITAGLPMPKVYVINDDAPNAFATGRDPNHSHLAVTTGLLEVMDDNELRAVIGHELSHIKNYDIRVSMIVFGLVCLVGFMSDFGLRVLFYSDRKEEDNSPVGALIALIVLILSPIVATLVQMGISRQREYLADASSATLIGNPDDMIAALRKLETHTRPMHQQNVATEAMYISNPLRKSTISKLFSTHPPIESRIERLENAKK